ncbi:high-affinity branched-chain amino acid transport system permease protein [Maritalea myrionectae]|uniref:High-affinity branched-chain amino acid transport system permease protein n=1 Tax=Maritalea myrionectae TaxID=454601 RepID=A0A2R4MHQ2_9HYPH|nr:branched-chain amino acid ABC transporter permease [Maritalea myrionectae]AVX05463.1 high-affinity branched-chain amino acid transport system permease protein [Maritalea myrionectae]
MLNLSRETYLNIFISLGLLVFPFIATAMDEPFYITLATRVAILSLAAVGLNLALGTGGLVSFGHAAFFGIGGYAMGILASHAQTYTPIFTWPFVIEGTNQMLIIWLVAIVMSGIAALFIGLLSLRTSGVYFIMITLAFAQMIYYFMISWPTYGGEDGLSIYVRNQFPGVNTLDPASFFYICLVLMFAGLGLSAMIKNSRFGAALQAARQNEERLAATGIRPFNIKLTAFVISGMITGLAGALMADLNRFISPSMLSWHMSGEIMVLVILGGVGRLYGPVVGALIYIIFEFIFGGMTDYWQFYLGLILLGVVLFARGGAIGLLAGKARHD